MSDEISPAVERAVEAAKTWATRLHAPAPRYLDWLLGLLDDDEGRPWELLQKAGVDLPRFVGELQSASIPSATAAPNDELLRKTRATAIRLKADPALTTDCVMLTVLAADPALTTFLQLFDTSLPTLEQLARSPLVDPPRVDIPEPPKPPVEFRLVQPSDTLAAARIIDANLNRARESLRVLDDFARFVRNDRHLTEDCKTLRHRLAAASELLPAHWLVQSRDTQHDVGTSISIHSEYSRADPDHVARSNVKRLQESLRSIEEYGKLTTGTFSQEIERIRYQTYTLERALFPSRKSTLQSARLYVLLTGSQCVNTLDWTITEAAAGGATIFQLREKELNDRELLQRAKDVRKWTRKAGALFIMNDRPDIARLADADGVHVGQDDLSIFDARQIVGPDAIIGTSTHTLEQLQTAVREGADYVGIGPTFPSRTKEFEQLAGLEFIRQACAETTIPMFALGGINLLTIRDAVAAGATRVAVSAAIAEVDEPRTVAAELRSALPE